MNAKFSSIRGVPKWNSVVDPGVSQRSTGWLSALEESSGRPGESLKANRFTTARRESSDKF